MGVGGGPNHKSPSMISLNLFHAVTILNKHLLTLLHFGFSPPFPPLFRKDYRCRNQKDLRRLTVPQLNQVIASCTGCQIPSVPEMLFQSLGGGSTYLRSLGSVCSMLGRYGRVGADPIWMMVFHTSLKHATELHFNKAKSDMMRLIHFKLVA